MRRLRPHSRGLLGDGGRRYIDVTRAQASAWSDEPELDAARGMAVALSLAAMTRPKSASTGSDVGPVPVPASERQPRERRVGELLSRPQEPSMRQLPPGEHRLGLDGARDGSLYVPAGRGAAFALLVLLHGAGGRARQMLAPFREVAERHGVLLLAPESRAISWDILVDRKFGRDVLFIDRALALVFERFPVAATSIALGGFSDGASYALSLGLSNGGLFSSVLAFSPGFAAPPRIDGFPRIFIAHGTQDPVLAIDRTSRRIVPKLRAVGLPIDYREFNGAHVIAPELVDVACEGWLEPG